MYYMTENDFLKSAHLSMPMQIDCNKNNSYRPKRNLPTTQTNGIRIRKYDNCVAQIPLAIYLNTKRYEIFSVRLYLFILPSQS